jgi:CBS domain-containing protein
MGSYWGLRMRAFRSLLRPEQPHHPMDTPVAALIERKGSAVHSVVSTITIADAVAEMNKRRIGCILVIDDGRIAGIFTERDVLRRVVGAGVNPKTTLVADVMTRDVHTIPPETSVEQTMVLFAERRCRHIPVVDDCGLKGLISIGDISRWMADSSRTEAEHLKNYIAGGFTA